MSERGPIKIFVSFHRHGLLWWQFTLFNVAWDFRPDEDIHYIEVTFFNFTVTAQTCWWEKE